MTAVATDVAPARRPVALLARPRDFFRSLEATGSFRQPLILLSAAVPLVPLFTAYLTYGSLRAELLARPEVRHLAGNAAIIAIGFGVLALLLQILALGAHLVVFSLAARVLGSRARPRLMALAWLLAMSPLIFRQMLYLAVAAGMGTSWLTQRASWIQAVDPFLVWTAVLLYFACRHCLGLSRLRAGVVTFLSSFIGLLGLVTSA